LATHSKANDRLGDQAFLAFTALDDDEENEILYNRDLYNLQLNADMVVLSACETGIGELQNAEGVISIARGFSYAGAKSIVSSLWAVQRRYDPGNHGGLLRQFSRRPTQG
jgi:CHAT domain-containing protein